MSTTASGRAAESAVADQLQASGHEILAQNWRRPNCEIDIVSKHKGIVYLTEVKFRMRTDFGSGFDYITPTKQKQMRFAEKVWRGENGWDGDTRLLAADVTGSQGDYQIELVEV